MRKASRNFIISDNEKLTFVDLDQHFVEPVVKELSLNGLYKVQFCHILFCLDQANNQPLDVHTLQAYCTLEHTYSIINTWIEHISTIEQQYLQLFTKSEREGLYTLNKKTMFSPVLLLREGVLGSLLINLNYLQAHLRNALNHNKLPTALELLEFINPRLGYYYRQAYLYYPDPEKRFQAATNAPQASIPSSLAIKASVGIIPTFEQIEGESKYSLTEARKELSCLLFFKPDFNKLVDKFGKPDVNRQSTLLKSLSSYPHKHLSLSYCAILDDDVLKDILNKSTQLQTLDLRACPKLTNKAIKYLAIQHTHLENLYLSDNPGITAIEDGILIKTSLYWPSLQKLHISHCMNLVSLNINAPKLTELKDTGCTKLQNKQLFAPLLNKPWIETPLTVSGYENVINVIIWVESQAIKYYAFNTEPYLYQTKTVLTHLYQESKTIDSRSFGSIDIVLLVYDSENKASITKTEQIAQHIYGQASHPLPILIISVSRKGPKPDIVYAGAYDPGSDKSAVEVIKDVVGGAPTAALLFHKAMIHQLQTGVLRGTKSMQLPQQFYLTRSGIPGLKVIAVSKSNDKADHTNRYFTGSYRVMHVIVGVEPHLKEIIVNNQNFHIDFLDFAVRERFMSIIRSFYRNTSLALIFAPLDLRVVFLADLFLSLFLYDHRVVAGFLRKFLLAFFEAKALA